MTAMTRRLVNLLTALSLLMCVAVVVLWACSYAWTAGVVHSRPGRASFVGTYRGRVVAETAGRTDTSLWPGLRGLFEGTRLAAARSETLVIDAPGVKPAGVLGFQR